MAPDELVSVYVSYVTSSPRSIIVCERDVRDVYQPDGASEHAPRAARIITRFLTFMIDLDLFSLGWRPFGAEVGASSVLRSTSQGPRCHVTTDGVCVLNLRGLAMYPRCKSRESQTV